MTWHTAYGDRVLRGAEARLIQESIASMVDDLLESRDSNREEPVMYGVLAFDELGWSQRLSTLETVSRHLLIETPETLKLTSPNEATVGAIFENVIQHIDFEIALHGMDLLEGGQESVRWRQLVLEASQHKDEFIYSEAASDEHFENGAQCDDLEEWRYVIESLIDQVLWDRDYEIVSLMDLPPAIAASVKSEMGVDGDYFVAIVEDPHEHELDGLVQRVRELTSRKPR